MISIPKNANTDSLYAIAHLRLNHASFATVDRTKKEGRIRKPDATLYHYSATGLLTAFAA